MRLRSKRSADAARPTLLTVVVIILAIPLLVFGWWGVSKLFDSTSTTHYSADTAVDRVQLDTGDVAVKVRQADVGTVSIDTKGTYFIDKPSVSHTVDGKALEVRADCGNSWTTLSCDTTMTVTVPRGVDVSLDGGSGDVDLDGLSGQIAVKSDTGDVSGSGLVSSDILALSASGDIDLNLAQTPRRLDTSTDNGDIDLAVPRAHYALDARSDEGDTTISGITKDASSTHTIRSVSTVGDISIAGRSS
jgi:DUF4097 and DUF4098 domain-containing protein YvlB